LRIWIALAVGIVVFFLLPGHPHELVSFAFNVAILRFAINITAGLVSG